jgi:ADP-heptose:LPS heptosyltransferase
LLIEESQMHVAIIGGPDEEEVAKSVLERVRNTRSVWNLIGKFKLGELPGFLSACALFVGNNSGPQHIAAGIGVPTIGIHSGVVDAHEWGPLGPMAIALRRDMVCSPCYLEKPEDCSRGLACLQGLRPGDVYRSCVALLQAGPAAS